jgi:hypothetical protein
MTITHVFVSPKSDGADTTLVRPSNWNAVHAGTLAEADLATTDITTGNVSTSKHGWAPKAPNDATKFLDGTGAYDTVKESDLSTSDITTGDVSTSKHGLAPKAPNDTTKFLRGDATWAAPVASTPTFYGKVASSIGQGDPATALWQIQRNGIAPTPTNITTSIARCSMFRLPFALTVNTIRYYSVANAGTMYHVALYRYSDLARLTADLQMSHSSGTFGSVGSSLGLALTAGTLYFAAVSVTATGATAGLAAVGGSIAATTGQIQVAPQDLPGNLDADAGYLNGFFFDMPVTTGVLPDPAATPAAQSAWTGGMPVFFLDNA